MLRIATLVMCWMAALAAAWAQCTPGQPPGMVCTPNLNLYLPPQGYPSWNLPMNSNFTTVDTMSRKWGILNSANSNNGEVLINSNGGIGSIPGFVYSGNTLSGNLTLTASFLTALGSGYMQSLPYTPSGSATNLPPNLLICLQADGMAHVCPASTTYWNGISQSTGTDSQGRPVANIFIAGTANCQFDGGATVGNFVVASTITAGQCHDSGTNNLPSVSGTLVGQVAGALNGQLAAVNIVRGGGGAVPSSQVTWPPSCSTGVYSPSTNTCIPAGLASNPAGNPNEVQINANGNFGTSTHFTYNDTTGLTAGPQGGVLTNALPGYRQNQQNTILPARSRDRDPILRVEITPQDMPDCQQSGQGLIDDAACFNKAIQYLGTFEKNITKILRVPYTVYGYTFRKNGFWQILPHDFGDYHGWAGYTTQASVGLVIVAGLVQDCTANGGSGYAPNANLPVLIVDPSLRGSGAAAYVQTDGTGLPISCAVVANGMNYPNTGVVTGVMPLGGDGATGTCQLTSGAVSGCTVTTGGSGYVTLSGTYPSVIANIPGLSTDLVCPGGANYPVFTSVTTSNSITGVNITNAGSGCTYKGASTATMPLVFGASCGNAQCNNLDPEPVNEMPCAVGLRSGITIEGVGNPKITTEWDAATANTSQLIAFCEPSGFSSTNITVKNLTIDRAFIGFYFPFQARHLVMDNVTFGVNVAFPVHVFSFGGSMNQGNGVTNPVDAQQPVGLAGPNLPSVFTNILDLGYSGISCGGEWIARTAASFNTGGNGQWNGTSYTVAAGYQNLLIAAAWGSPYGKDNMGINSHYNNSDYTNPCGNVKVDTFNFTVPGTSVNGGKWDTFWETYIWKTQNGPAVPWTNATNLMSNGMTSCKTTQTVAVDRTVDYWFGNPAQSSAQVTNYPYFQCFTGILYSPFVFVPRYSGGIYLGGTIGAAPVSFNHIQAMKVYRSRSIITGRIDDLRVTGLNMYINNDYTANDPYQQTGQLIGGINISTRYVAGNYRIDDMATPLVNTYNATFNPNVQIMLNGLVNNQGLVIRNVGGIGDQGYPAIGNLGATVPTGPAVATLSLIDTNNGPAATGTGYGSGGAMLFSANSYPQGFAAIKGSFTAQTTNPQGDLVFYTRPVIANALAEALRLQVAGNWRLTKPDVAAGTQTITGCSLTGAVGGAAAGRFASGVSGTCTVTITPGVTAPNGYRCAATDMTTPADLVNQTTSTTTTCILSGTTVSGDLITWQAIAF